jgi:hypothetical protein
MTTKSKAEKSGAIEAEPDAPAVETRDGEPAEIVTRSIAAEPVVEIEDIVSTPLAVIEEAVESAGESFSASFKLDSASFTQKSLELWSENANAFFSFLEKFAQVKSFEEAVELQTRFANERLDAFLRQSKELMESARDMASLSSAPLCGAKKAA